MADQKYTYEELNEILKQAFDNEDNPNINDFKEAAAELGINEEEFRIAEQEYKNNKKKAEQQAILRKEKRRKMVVSLGIFSVLAVVIIYFILPRGAYQGKYNAYLTTKDANFLFYGGTENIEEFYVLENKHLVCQLQILEPTHSKYEIDFKLFNPKGILYQEKNHVAYRHDKQELNYAIGSFDFYGFYVKNEDLGDWKVEVWVDKKLLKSQKIKFKLANPNLSVALVSYTEWDKNKPKIVKPQYSQSLDLKDVAYKLDANMIMKVCQDGIFTLQCTNPNGKLITATEERFTYKPNTYSSEIYDLTVSLALKSFLEKTNDFGTYKIEAFYVGFGQNTDKKNKLKEHLFELVK